jgi:hypothetical protein
MPIATVKQLCTPSNIVKSDSLVDQVAQVEARGSPHIGQRARAPRQMRMPAKDHGDKEAEEMFSQRKRPESGRYLLQVDRQTKGSYKTAQAAQSAGLEIKTGYPIVQVSIYDSVDNTHTLVKLPATSS